MKNLNLDIWTKNWVHSSIFELQVSFVSIFKWWSDLTKFKLLNFPKTSPKSIAVFWGYPFKRGYKIKQQIKQDCLEDWTFEMFPLTNHSLNWFESNNEVYQLPVNECMSLSTCIINHCPHSRKESTRVPEQ